MKSNKSVSLIICSLFISFTSLYGGDYPDTLTAYLGTTPTLDGYISEGEYSDAEMITGPQGWIEPGTVMTDDSCDLGFKVWYKHDGNYLYFAFDVSDTIIYAFDTDRWVPDKFPNSNALERTVGRPFFGDGIEIFMNATNRNDETNSIGDGTFWQTILSTHKSYFGGLEYGGLIQGIPYSEYAWENYENWYDSAYMKASVRIKSKEEGRGYVAEWRISPDPCLQIHETDSVFVDFSKENKLGINIEFQDVDKKETSNTAGFQHVVYFAQVEGIHKKYAKSFATLLITPEAMNPDTSNTGIMDSHLDVSSANYPNPFSVTTTIRYQKLQAAHTNLAIYNLYGQHIKTLVNSHETYGDYRVDWNGTDNNNRVVPDGVYFYVLTSVDAKISRKMVLLR